MVSIVFNLKNIHRENTEMPCCILNRGYCNVIYIKNFSFCWCRTFSKFLFANIFPLFGSGVRLGRYNSLSGICQVKYYLYTCVTHQVCQKSIHNKTSDLDIWLLFNRPSWFNSVILFCRGLMLAIGIVTVDLIENDFTNDLHPACIILHS